MATRPDVEHFAGEIVLHKLPEHGFVIVAPFDASLVQHAVEALARACGLRVVPFKEKYAPDLGWHLLPPPPPPEVAAERKAAADRFEDAAWQAKSIATEIRRGFLDDEEARQELIKRLERIGL